MMPGDQRAERRQVFLSHSGRDADRVNALAATLERRLTELGDHVTIFNTSEPEDRFESLQQRLRAGQEWLAHAEQYDRELREYLARNMETSAAFVALVTRNSLSAGSEFIEFEIEMAHSIATRNKKMFFFPVVDDRAELRQLPPLATEFQGIDLGAKDGRMRLVDQIHRALAQGR